MSCGMEEQVARGNENIEVSLFISLYLLLCALISWNHIKLSLYFNVESLRSKRTGTTDMFHCSLVNKSFPSRWRFLLILAREEFLYALIFNQCYTDHMIKLLYSYCFCCKATVCWNHVFRLFFCRIVPFLY